MPNPRVRFLGLTTIRNLTQLLEAAYTAAREGREVRWWGGEVLNGQWSGGREILFRFGGASDAGVRPAGAHGSTGER